MQALQRQSMDWWSRSNKPGFSFTFAVSQVILATRFISESTGIAYTKPFSAPQRKKSMLLKSGDRSGQVMIHHVQSIDDQTWIQMLTNTCAIMRRCPIIWNHIWRLTCCGTGSSKLGCTFCKKDEIICRCQRCGNKKIFSVIMFNCFATHKNIYICPFKLCM